MNGILLVDKPEGWTSHDVVAKLRGVLRERRIGHSGTLDPMATGLLVVFVGRATRAVEFAEAQEKRYIAGFRPGITTDTQDITGTVLSVQTPDFTPDGLERAADCFRGNIMQIPPMYSAIKVNGQKLYDIARRGGSVERRPRSVTISKLALVGMRGDDYLLDVTCSKGTYIRTLCHDLGIRLGCGGCMSSLRRMRAGEFDILSAHTMDEILARVENGEAESLLLPVDRLFDAYPAHTLNAAQERRVRCGNAFAAGIADGNCRVYGESGEFLALCAAEGGSVNTIKSFFEVNIK